MICFCTRNQQYTTWALLTGALNHSRRGQLSRPPLLPMLESFPGSCIRLWAPVWDCSQRPSLRQHPHAVRFSYPKHHCSMRHYSPTVHSGWVKHIVSLGIHAMASNGICSVGPQTVVDHSWWVKRTPNARIMGSFSKSFLLVHVISFRRSMKRSRDCIISASL